jgi:hypothetical protein
MEVGQGPNVGCSAKGKKKAKARIGAVALKRKKCELFCMI